MKTAEKDFDSGIEEKQREDQIAKNAPEVHPPLYGRQGRVKPDPETNPLANLDCEKVPIFTERVRAVDPKHAFRLQLLGGDVDVHLAQPR